MIREESRDYFRDEREAGLLPRTVIGADDDG
jgi:hypothetical protein